MFASSGSRAWWSDDPIQSAAGDRLGRGPFAQRLADLLMDIGNEPSSTVVGLVGPWGSGKSSTINLTRRILSDQGWSVVELNPWALPDPVQVIAEVLAAVGHSVPLQGSRRQRTKLLRSLAGYASYILPVVKAIPVAGAAVAEAGAAVLKDVLAEDSQPEIARKLNELLGQIKPRLLICVDDVDRLQPEELLMLFRAVRVLGRLHHVHYLLSYDEETVLDLLSRTPVAWGRPDRALDFLEKIVTVRLDQPPTREDQAAEIFDAELEVLIQAVGLTTTEEQHSRLSVERSALLDYTLTEPRAVRRFFTQLHAYLPLLGPMRSMSSTS